METEKKTTEKKKLYITTTLPYVNSDPHIGFAMEIIRADVIARYKKSLGYDVFFNTGTDEHGAKIYENAQKENKDVQQYVDFYAEKFKSLTTLLGIDNDIHFIRTTDEKHIVAAKEIWKRCYDNGYIYKKNYQAKYCVGCELNKTDSELENNKCPIHPNRDIELIDEENYFFKWSKFSGRGHKNSLLDFYDKNQSFVIPNFRYNEIKAFVERGLEDFSISRIKEKMPWGVALPKGACDEGDENKHVMYVWFDALTSYISTLNWPEQEKFEKFWAQNGQERNVIQYCGKDNNRQQSAMWQAMLMAVGLPNSTQIVINGFVNGIDGLKMSKSLGNVINPVDATETFKPYTEYAEEVIRFFVLQLSSFEDASIDMNLMKEIYSAYLANGIGNQVNRIMKLSSQYISQEEISEIIIELEKDTLGDEFEGLLNEYKINEALALTMNEVKSLDEYIQSTEPFKLIKKAYSEDKTEIVDQKSLDEAKVIIKNCLLRLGHIGHQLYFFMPRTAYAIYNTIKDNKMPEKPMFNRLDNI